MKKIINKHLGELLIDLGALTQEQLDKALVIQRQKNLLLGEVLVEMAFVKEEEIAQALTVQYGFPFLPLGNYEISSEMVNLVPAKLAKENLLIPIDKIGNNLTIAMAYPLNEKAILEVEAISKCNVQIFVSTLSDVKKAIARYYK